MAHATINDVELFYDDQGTGEPILFHHGFTGSHDAWDEIVPTVSTRYRCIRMDGRGAGDSAHPATGNTIEQFADDVIGMADHLGLTRFTYVGHSMGGVVGMELGIRYGARLNKLVLVAPAPSDGLAPNPAMVAMRERALRMRAEGRAEELVKESLLMSPGATYALAKRRLERGWATSEAHVTQAMESMGASRRGELLASVTTPTLVMAGAADFLLGPNLKDFQRLPNATLHVFSRVSHGVNYDQPVEFTKVLLDFMEHGVVTQATLMKGLQDSASQDSASRARAK